MGIVGREALERAAARELVEAEAAVMFERAQALLEGERVGWVRCLVERRRAAAIGGGAWSADSDVHDSIRRFVVGQLMGLPVWIIEGLNESWADRHGTGGGPEREAPPK